ncbi:MAG: hypothetical protein WD577_05190 [Bacteroidales bacterium]
MRKITRNIFKWLFRIIAGLVTLVLLVILLFYLFRGRITDKTLEYVNSAQPGELSIGSLNLRPFMNFPDISVRVGDLKYTTGTAGTGKIDTLPVISMSNIYVSLDIVKLIRGEYKISKVRLNEGTINYIIESDSVSNLERALGIRFESSAETDSLQTDSLFMVFDLESLTIRDLNLNFHDIPGKTDVSTNIFGLEAGFSYHPDEVTASVMMHTEISRVIFDDIVLDKARDFSFSSSLKFDQVRQKLLLDNSLLDMHYAIFGLGGAVDFSDQTIDMQFSARNSGIELLNFLLNGILNLDAIEQIGEGHIQLSGNILGSFDESIPEINVNFSAADMGFRVHAINQSVTDIGFEGVATSGRLTDFSEAEININGFHVSFPQGDLDAEIVLKNLVAPEIDVELNGKTDLRIIEEIIDRQSIQRMRGSIGVSGNIRGTVDMDAGTFQDNTGALVVSMDDVGFSFSDNTVEKMNGLLYLEENRFGFREMGFSIDSNEIRMEGWVDNLLPYLMGYKGDINAMVLASSDEFSLDKYMDDTLFTEPLRDVAFSLALQLTGSEINAALKEKSIPKGDLEIRELQLGLPGYADITDVNLTLLLDKDRIVFSDMNGVIGESDFTFKGELENYSAYLEEDSSAHVSIKFDIGSDKLRMKDLFTINDQFEILPVAFAGEEIQHLQCKGKVETTVYDLLSNSTIPNISFALEELKWDLKHYPHSFRDFAMELFYQDSLLVINRFNGSVGESDFKITASVAHLLDTAGTIRGNLEIQSDLLDADALMNYALIEKVPADTVLSELDNSAKQPSAGLAGFDFPDLELKLDLKEVRYAGNTLRSINGEINLRHYKIIYFNDFAVQSETGGSMLLDGQFNVSDPDLYMLSAKIDVDTVNVSDFNLQFAMEDSTYSLEDNFNGLLSTDGIAELFINPDFSIDLDQSTAMFNVLLTDGRVKNFAPLQEIARYTGNKDLDNVKFGELRNGRSFSLVGGVVQIPLMSISSTLGLILIEGEQGLGGDFLYLVRVPTKLIRGTARNILSGQQRKDPDEEEEIQRMEAQKFALITVYSDGEEVEVKMGDKRDQFR